MNAGDTFDEEGVVGNQQAAKQYEAELANLDGKLMRLGYDPDRDWDHDNHF
jgi:hypothetical protein